MRRHRSRAAILAVCTAVILSVAWRESPQKNSTAAASGPAQTGTEPEVESDPAARPHVIVVGAGISGLATALDLGRGDATVTVVDMSSVFGGHAVMSQGGVSIVDLPVQQESGFEDSPELAARDFIEWGEDGVPDWVRYYVENSRHAIYEWLTGLGVRFEGVLPARGNSVDRFHQPVGRGIGLVVPIYQACLTHENIYFVWNTQATRLLRKSQRVVGIETRNLRDDSLSN